MTRQRQWTINGQPRGRALAESDFALREVELEPLAEGEARVRAEYFGFDPSQKGQMENIGYAAATSLGQVMTARGIGEVVESRTPRLAVGDKVIGMLGWQEFATVKPDAVTVIPNDELLTAHLGPLGGTGLTAYFGLVRHGRPEPGDTLVVSGAAGATGSVVGQIGRIMGCRVVGIAGGADKCAWLVDELGFDAAIDYRNDSVKQRLRESCPGGVNVFFDNVGGAVLDAVLDHLAMRARVVICGAISQYDHMDAVVGPSMYLRLAERQSTMEGFAYFHFPESIPEATAELASWLADGSLRSRDEVLEGIERYPEALQFMFNGGNTGKLLVKIG
jgi:hypothetical protein